LYRPGWPRTPHSQLGHLSTEVVGMHHCVVVLFDF
jgi:hypothetical protein